MTQGAEDDLIGGRYRLIQQIGKGAMGAVWQAHDELLDRTVAIKLLIAPPDATAGARARQIERVTREARMAARLNHPGIVQVHDVIDREGLPVIVMEYIDGRSLAAQLRESGHLSVRETARIGMALLDALRHAHAAGVLHRDLKPDNILLTRERVVITDFGIAQPIGDFAALTVSGAMVGTPAYMAPEQIDGKEASTASDLWSLGATLYTALEGTPPFEGETIPQVCRSVLTRPMRPPHNASVLTPLLEELLTKDPARRATAESVALHLAAIDRPGPTPPLAEDLKTLNPAARQAAGPRQLPPDTALFTGRGAELEQLLGLVGQSETVASPGAVVISAIDGMGGVGKTALAVRAGHRLAERFPDGQLFIDLYGFTQGTAPRSPSDALAVLLGSLGVPPQQMPADLDSRAAFYRDRLAGTHTLLILDNAADEAQVRPLLPASDGCLVLVTSRRRLKALDEAVPVPVDVLPIGEAVALLRKAARLGSAPADEPLLEQVAELCGRLPLALLIAGAVLRTGRRAWSLPLLIDRLSVRRPGDELAGYTDETRSLKAVFDLSYQHLSEDLRPLFRHAGLVPGPEIDAYAAAALVQSDPESAGRLLERLADHSLLEATAPGRYHFHELIRSHARSLAVALDAESERDAALDRLLRFYAHTAQTHSLPIARLPRSTPDGPAPTYAPDPRDPDAARAWLRTEYPNLDAAFTHASSNALDGNIISLAAGLAEILQTDGPWTRALEIHRTAAEAADLQGQGPARASALSDLAWAQYLTGDYSRAVQTETYALEIYRQTGHRLGEANALADLGRIQDLAGDFPNATETLTHALGIYRELDSSLGKANALTNLARVQSVTGNLPQAADTYVQALEIFRRIDHRQGEATVLTNLGQARFLTGDIPRAAADLAQALDIYRQIGHRQGEATALTHLGRVRYSSGEFSGALNALTHALEIVRQISHRQGEANTLTFLGQVRSATGDVPGAADAQTQALDIYRGIGNRYGEAMALTRLGELRHASGDLPEAAEALAEALEIFHQIDNRSSRGYALNRFAATTAALGDRTQALSLYQEALAINSELKKPDDEAVSLEGIGEHHLAQGAIAEGVGRLRQALEIYDRLGMRVDAERVRARLTELPPE